MIELPRSTFYYQALTATNGLADAQLVELIQTIQDELPGYGYRRVTHELRRRGHTYSRWVSSSKLDPYAEKLAIWLGIEAANSRKQRRNLKQIYISKLSSDC